MSTIPTASSSTLLLLVSPLEPDLDGPAMGLELLNLCELHDGTANVAKTLFGELAAGDVFDKGGEVDAGVLAGVAVCCCWLC